MAQFERLETDNWIGGLGENFIAIEREINSTAMIFFFFNIYFNLDGFIRFKVGAMQ